MNQTEALDIIQKSEYFSRVIEKLDREIFTWAEKEKLYKLFINQIKRYEHITREFPDEWIRGSSNQFVAAKVLGNPATLRKFLHNYKDSLGKEEKDLILFFYEQPWIYSLFTIKASMANNILIAEDCSTKKEFRLYSQNIPKLHKRGKHLFLCLLYDNGKCYQTYGLIHYYTGFTVEDFTSFAREVSFHYNNSQSLSESIYHNPVEYMLLDNFSESPATVHGSAPLVFCAHAERIASFDPSDYKAYFNFQESRGIIRGRLKKSEGPMSFTDIYYDKKKQTLLLHAFDLLMYQELVRILADKYTLPLIPGWFFSGLMAIAVSNILRKEDPVLKYEEYFEPPVEPGKNESLAPLNALMSELTEHQNTGTPYTAEELAHKYAIPLETVNQLEAMLSDMDKKFMIDVKGGFPGFIPPPPAKRDQFGDALEENRLFELNSQAEAKIRDLNLGVESIADFFNLLNDLYFRVWNKRGYTLLMYTLYLLHKKGNTYQEVDDYAAECLKTFWQVLIPSKLANNIERFIRQYRQLCIQVLQRTGLIMVEKPVPDNTVYYDAYRIRVTDFFRELFRFKA